VRSASIYACAISTLVRQLLVEKRLPSSVSLESCVWVDSQPIRPQMAFGTPKK
jgi:hypothetical protein